MASFADGKIEVFLGSDDLGAPDDLEGVLVEFIAGARRSLSIAVQELDSRPVAQAILDARWRGVRVEVFLEQDYLQTSLAARPADPAPEPDETADEARRRVQWDRRPGGLSDNRAILAALLGNDITVKGDYNPAIFHQKFILRDYDGTATPGSALLTGSANLTVTDTHRNLNHLIVFHSAYVCRRYLDEVQQLRRGEFGRGRHGPVPATYDLSGVPVKVLFAPDHTPELELMKQILKARKEIVFAIFTFAGSSGIDDALLAMADNPQIPAIRGVLDPGQAAHGWAAPAWLEHPKIQLFVPERTGVFASLRKVHHKLMVIDRRVVVAGSMNHTRPANDFNDENLFVIGSTHDEVEGIEVVLQPSRDLALHVRSELERIIDLSRPFHPADG